MIGEWLIVRAVRYQWRSGLVLLVSVFGAAQPFRGAVNERTTLLRSRMVGFFGAGATPSQNAPLLTEAMPKLGWNEPLSAREKSTKERTENSARLTFLLASRRGLDREIALARWKLHSASDGQEPTETASPAASPSPAEIFRAVPRPDQIALRNEIVKQRARVDALSAIDTDLHPDLVEARETLSSLQRKLTISREHNEAPIRVEAAPSQESPVATAAEPLLDQAMPELALLIQARARIDRKIQAATDTVSPKLVTSEDRVPLLGSVAQTNHPPDQTRKTIKAFSMMPFEVGCGITAALLSLMVLIVIEGAGDHIAGPISLESQLPDSVVFFRTIPRMRGSV